MIIVFTNSFLFHYSVDTSIVYRLRVLNVFPRQGSLMGGQKLTITGEGFSTTGLNDVTLGDSACVEESATNTQVHIQYDKFVFLMPI